MPSINLAAESKHVELLAALRPGYADILTPEALGFVAVLEQQFGARRRELLANRGEIQARLDAGERPDFLTDTAHIRTMDWTVAPPPADLNDRRVEITGPPDRKMIINALNSGAKVFMADFEDACTPTWTNLLEGQVNLHDAVRGTIEWQDPQSGNQYCLGDAPATLVVRPRNWHLLEQHLRIDGERISGALFDFGLYVFHNAHALLDNGTGPYFYLAKMENHLEARLWNDVFDTAQDLLGLPTGTIKATVLIETILAAFQMDEILYELRDHAVGLNCGRWDYIFNFIKRFSAHPEFVLPDRGQITMNSHFLRSYSQLLIKTCHRRKAHAMGGMAAQIPIKSDAAANAVALAKVRADKEREVRDGHDGTWVAHPALVPVAMEVFDQHMPGPNQIDVTRDDVDVGADDLLRVPEGSITEAGFRENVRVGLQYLEAWLRGHGAVPINHLMEDAATAEISRAQLAQWIRHSAELDDGRTVTEALFWSVLAEEFATLRAAIGEEVYQKSRFLQARALFEDIITSGQGREFLTMPAYDQLLATEVLV